MLSTTSRDRSAIYGYANRLSPTCPPSPFFASSLRIAISRQTRANLVVHILRDARAFALQRPLLLQDFDSSFHLSYFNVPNCSPNRAKNSNESKRPEPPRLPERWRNDDGDRHSLFIPNAVVVGALHSEDIASAIEIGVCCISPCAAVYPIIIEAFELVGVLVLLGTSIVLAPQTRMKTRSLCRIFRWSVFRISHCRAQRAYRIS